MENKLSTLVDRDSRVTDKSGNTGEFVKNGYNYEYRFNQCTVVNGEVVSKPTFCKILEKFRCNLRKS
jgi:hypothetical protein